MEKKIGERYQKHQGEKKLKYGIIEVTTQCQCRCPGCYMVKRDLLQGEQMTLEQAVNILDLCQEYIGQELETMDILGGEPLLWPHLKEYLEILLNRGIKPWIFTNMLAITPRLARWLFQRKIHITGKLNINPSDSSQLYLQAEMIGRNVAIAEKMISAINIFLETGYRDPLFRLQNLIRKRNINLVPEYYQWCLERGIGTDLELMGSGEPINEEYWRVALKPLEIAEMIVKIQEVRRSFDLEELEVLMPHVFGSCPFYDKGLYFGVDGHIRSCSNSTFRLSYVTDPEPIKMAFESPLICNRILLSKELVGEPCNSCEKWEKCRGGCRATVEGMGNPFGGYTLCPVPFLKKDL